VELKNQQTEEKKGQTIKSCPEQKPSLFLETNLARKTGTGTNIQGKNCHWEGEGNARGRGPLLGLLL